MPLTSLASAEHLLPTDVFVGYGEATWGTDDDQRKHLVSLWGNLVLPLLEDVEVEYPQLPWAHGLRGLYYLWGIHLTGLDSAHDGTSRGRALPEIDRRVPFLVRH
jgi:hypothetical protein